MFRIVLLIALLFSFQAGADDQGARNQYVDYVVGVGDEIKVKVYRSPDLDTDARVNADGMISFPLVGQVKVANHTTTDIQKMIAKSLIEKKLLVSPQVNVVVTDYQSKTFSVFGHVVKAGKYPIKRPLKLTDAIALAGGYQVTASDIVTIVSNVDGKTVKRDLDTRRLLEDITGDANPFIRNGDVVQVPKHAVFYIHGQVNKPGEYKVEPNMRVSQALAKGGGVTLRGTTRSMVIERTGNDGKVSELRAKMNVIVLPNDVIFVDESLF